MLHVRPRWLRLPNGGGGFAGRLSSGAHRVAEPAEPAAMEDLWHVQTPDPQVPSSSFDCLQDGAIL